MSELPDPKIICWKCGQLRGTIEKPGEVTDDPVQNCLLTASAVQQAGLGGGDLPNSTDSLIYEKVIPIGIDPGRARDFLDRTSKRLASNHVNCPFADAIMAAARASLS